MEAQGADVVVVMEVRGGSSPGEVGRGTAPGSPLVCRWQVQAQAVCGCRGRKWRTHPNLTALPCRGGSGGSVGPGSYPAQLPQGSLLFLLPKGLGAPCRFTKASPSVPRSPDEPRMAVRGAEGWVTMGPAAPLPQRPRAQEAPPLAGWKWQTLKMRQQLPEPRTSPFKID